MNRLATPLVDQVAKTYPIIAGHPTAGIPTRMDGYMPGYINAVTGIPRMCRTMAVYQPSKLRTWVQFPSHASTVSGPWAVILS